jgi:hypothetical protein
MPDADTIQDCDQSDILEAVERFYTRVLKLPKDSLFPSQQPMAPPVGLPGGSYWLTVTIGDGSFPLEEQFPEQLREDTTFTVTGFTRVQLDEKGRDHKLLKDDQRGLLRIKRRMLSIVGQQLTLDDGTPIGADRVYAVRASKPEAVSNATTNLGTISVTFGLAYDWDLPEAPGDD